MSTLTQFAGGGVKSIQTGYISTSTIFFGAGEETRYIDVTVSAVTNVAKCLVTISGSSYTIRMLNSTTIRIMANFNAGTITGRWTLVEYF